MTTEFVEITAFIREARANAVAVWDGTYDDQGSEVWTWLPRSLIQYNPRSREVRISLPLWLARDRELQAGLDGQQAETARLKARLMKLEARVDAMEKRLEARVDAIEKRFGLDQTRH